jgi:hypothetical protein
MHAEHVGEAEVDEFDFVFLDQVEHFLGSHGEPRQGMAQHGQQYCVWEQYPCHGPKSFKNKRLHHGEAIAMGSLLHLRTDPHGVRTNLVIST